MFGRIHYGERYVALNQYILSGVQGVNYTNTFNFTPINVMGLGKIKSSMNNLPVGQLSLNRFILGEDPILPMFLDLKSVSGAVFLKNNVFKFDTNNFIVNHSISTSVGQLVQSNTTINVFGEVETGNFDDFLQIEKITGVISGSGSGFFGPTTGNVTGNISGLITGVGTGIQSGLVSGNLSQQVTGFISGSGYLSGLLVGTGEATVTGILYDKFIKYRNSLKPVPLQIPTNQSTFVTLREDFGAERITAVSYELSLDAQPIYGIGTRYPIKMYRQFPITETINLTVEIDSSNIKAITENLCSSYEDDINIYIKTKCSLNNIIHLYSSGTKLTSQSYEGQIGSNSVFNLTYVNHLDRSGLKSYDVPASYLITGFTPLFLQELSNPNTSRILTCKEVCYRIDPYTGYLN